MWNTLVQDKLIAELEQGEDGGQPSRQTADSDQLTEQIQADVRTSSIKISCAALRATFVVREVSTSHGSTALTAATAATASC